ncbi:MAG: hypothetical protein ACOX1V_04880 [Candidatus Iainarchaeum sp.]
MKPCSQMLFNLFQEKKCWGQTLTLVSVAFFLLNIYYPCLINTLSV